MNKVFSMPLFKQSVKSNIGIWSAMTGVLTLLCIQFTSMEMTLPLLFQIFYGMMTTILPGIYILVSSNKLISGQVDRGSMAYVLSTPTRRSAVVFTQSIFMIASVTAMFTIMTSAHLIVNMMNSAALAKFGYIGLTGDLTQSMILKINLSAMIVCLAMAGICFAFSAIFNTSKNTLSLSGGFLGVMILGNMLAMFGKLGNISQLTNLRYVTLCSFFDYESVLFGSSDWIPKMIIPAAIAVIGFIAGGMVFRKKDLPL